MQKRDTQIAIADLHHQGYHCLREVSYSQIQHHQALKGRFWMSYCWIHPSSYDGEAL